MLVLTSTLLPIICSHLQSLESRLSHGTCASVLYFYNSRAKLIPLEMGSFQTVHSALLQHSTSAGEGVTKKIDGGPAKHMICLL